MSNENNDDGVEISAEEVSTLISRDTQPISLVDVREDWELSRGILPGAIHRPISRFADFENDWAENTPWIIYCEHGVRSLDVAMWLRQNKGIRAKSLQGGFAEWTGPVVQPSEDGGQA